MVSSIGKFNDKKDPYYLIFKVNPFCFSQEYSVEILGISAAKIKQTLSSDSVIYRIETDGLIDLFYPLENTYYSIFDPKAMVSLSLAKKSMRRTLKRKGQQLKILLIFLNIVVLKL